ncbi:MAG: sulfoxide reductase heme-binding subunit YedZ [Xanthomonadales bacterium]|nr:sulfoxide reductase heme-binding subunit YedZ [Xanthomonadales bacterium]
MQNIRLLKTLVFAACLIPFVLLGLAAFNLAGQSLGANPIEELLHQLGLWGLRFLLFTLAITPLRQLSGKTWLLQLRRMLGLFSFFYILLHFLSYAILDQGLSYIAIIEDIVERPYITLGMIALLMLIPLAISSTNGWMRRLGRRWKKLHQLVYVIAILGVWHFFWQVKLDTREPLIYAGILSVLLGYRLWLKFSKTRQAATKS